MVAYLLETVTVTPAAESWRPPTVTRSARWALGTVHAATKLGKVRELVPAGADGLVTANRVKMLAPKRRVTDVRLIPGDAVDGQAMLDGCRGVSWASLGECEDYVSRYMLTGLTLEGI